MLTFFHFRSWPLKSLCAKFVDEAAVAVVIVAAVAVDDDDDAVVTKYAVVSQLPDMVLYLKELENRMICF